MLASEKGIEHKKTVMSDNYFIISCHGAVLYHGGVSSRGWSLKSQECREEVSLEKDGQGDWDAGGGGFEK